MNSYFVLLPRLSYDRGNNFIYSYFTIKTNKLLVKKRCSNPMPVYLLQLLIGGS